MSSSEEDEHEWDMPDWISAEFIQDVLRSDQKNNNLEIIYADILPAATKGDNLVSCMYSAEIKYRTARNSSNRSCSLFIKTMPELNTNTGQTLANYPLFETEISMYTETLPEIERILSQHGDNTQFAPRVIYHSLSPHKIIIFEDLCSLGYDTIRDRYMNMEELKSVIVRIAKFHAVSYSIGKSEKAKMVTKFKNGLYSDSKCFQVELISGGIKRFNTFLQNNDELSIYLPQFQKAEKEVHQGCINLYKAYKKGDPDDIFVLNHGDFHVKNLMFKHNAKHKFEDVKMIDFQFSIFGPSVIDFTYAVFMMFDSTTRIEKHEEMMHFYFENFIDTLNKIHFKGKLPTYTQFQMSQLKYRALYKQMLVTILPMILIMRDIKMKDSKHVDMGEAVYHDDALMGVYYNPTFINEMRKYLPKLLNGGYLDTGKWSPKKKNKKTCVCQ